MKKKLIFKRKNYLLRETLIVKDYNTLIDNLLKLKENKL